MSTTMREPGPAMADGARSRLTAAGGVLWRDDGGMLEVLLVHRPTYDDWSLPKGKPEAGENPIQTAVREVTEETGLPFTLGVFLSSVQYRVGARPKSVSYWAMRLADGVTFEPSSVDPGEVDRFEWAPLRKAVGRLTYPADRVVLDRFAQVGTTPVSLLLVRHGTAGARHRWHGDDDLRPLDSKGRRQALAIARTLPAFAPTGIYSADPLRCRQTAEPLAEALHMKVRVEPRLGDRQFADDDERGFTALHELLRIPGPVVLTTQGEVVDTLTTAFQASDRPTRVGSKKGGLWVFGGVDDTIVTTDYYPTLLPKG